MFEIIIAAVFSAGVIGLIKFLVERKERQKAVSDFDAETKLVWDTLSEDEKNLLSYVRGKGVANFRWSSSPEDEDMACDLSEKGLLIRLSGKSFAINRRYESLLNRRSNGIEK